MLNKNFKPYYSKTPKENVKEVIPHFSLVFIPFVRIKSKIENNGYYCYDKANGKNLIYRAETTKT